MNKARRMTRRSPPDNYWRGFHAAERSQGSCPEISPLSLPRPRWRESKEVGATESACRVTPPPAGGTACDRRGRGCPGHSWPGQGHRLGASGWPGAAGPAPGAGRARASRGRRGRAPHRGRGRGRRAASREAPRGEGPELGAGGLLIIWRRELPGRLEEAAGPTPGRSGSCRASAAAAAHPEVRAGC